MATHNFEATFAELKEIMRKHEARLSVVSDDPTNYYLNTTAIDAKGKPYYFGAVQVKKNYVSFHLMPVYMYPDLLDDISPELKKHMQGKSCFNFKASDKALFRELTALTKRGVERMKKEGTL